MLAAWYTYVFHAFVKVAAIYRCSDFFHDQPEVNSAVLDILLLLLADVGRGFTRMKFGFSYPAKMSQPVVSRTFFRTKIPAYMIFG